MHDFTNNIIKERAASFNPADLVADESPVIIKLFIIANSPNSVAVVSRFSTCSLIYNAKDR